jgi:hypothetical protein
MADGTAGASEQPNAPEEQSFAALRRLGIELAQRLAAEGWTDYNVHDPGVTLLEQLCYALTDLINRADFDVADHLTAPDGPIDFERLGLELPERIFPARPTTVTDYRRVILDRVADVDDVWMRPMGDEVAAGTLPNGLYRILLRPRPGTAQRDRARIRSAVETVYNGFRNLCEDVQEITFVREVDCRVCADVEVERGRAPAEILAEIYHRCAEQIAARVRIHPFEQARQTGRSLEEIFTGPQSLHGYCEEADLGRGKKTHAVSEFFSLMNRVEGVDYVRNLYFEVRGKPERDAISADSSDESLRLHIPANPDEIRIQLSSHGRHLRVPFEAFQSGLDGWSLKGSGGERARQDVRKLYTEPRGEYRDLGQYTSIQTQLPSIYGVGANGLPESASPDVRAGARQLKGYLLLFDQLMANHTANVASLRDLFSPDISGRSTYASQLLDESQISGLDEIYPQRPAEPADVIADVVARYDNFEDRKGRLLDYLLALYGEGFSQNSLRAFNYYATSGERERALVENKLRFFRAIVEVTRDRGAAIDYRDPAQATVSGLQQRVSYLLGFADPQRRSLTAAFRAYGLQPVPDDLCVTPQGDNGGPDLCDSADVRPPDDLWEEEVPLKRSEAAQSLSQLIEQVGQLLPRQDGQVEEGILSSGVSLACYRLGHLEGDTAWQAFLRSGGEAPWWRLGSFSNRHDAIEAVNKLRRLIVLLNVESEGMHVVEHILLRPRDPAAPEGGASAADADFFSFRVSVVFPKWTARFRDRRFRQLAKETVCLNCPAHIVPKVLWLGFDDMLEFERLQEDWLQRLAGEGAAAGDVDAASARLVEFLIARRGEDCWVLLPTSENGQGSGE